MGGEEPATISEALLAVDDCICECENRARNERRGEDGYLVGMVGGGIANCDLVLGENSRVSDAGSGWDDLLHLLRYGVGWPHQDVLARPLRVRQLPPLLLPYPPCTIASPFTHVGRYYSPPTL